MERFARLYQHLDETTRTTVKVDALVDYFRETPENDAAWGLYFLAGNKLRAPVKTRDLRTWVADASGLPLWLIEETYHQVGDLAETIALLTPETTPSEAQPPHLHQCVERILLPLKTLPDDQRRQAVIALWSRLNARQRFLFNKLLTGGLRVGVSRTLVIRALAQLAGVAPAIMAHRLMGDWQPSAEAYHALFSSTHGHAEEDRARPYPFCLAHPLDDAAARNPPPLPGPIDDWQIEWKWDGIRAQLIRRQGRVMLWSRGEEMIEDRYPEITTAAAHLPDGLVLDGEILGWKDDHPLPFTSLQRRINRRSVSPKMMADLPVIFMVYDCLESNGQDLREATTTTRRAALKDALDTLPLGLPLRLSPTLDPADWEAALALRNQARNEGTEGLMIKRRSSPYRTGRVKGDWWKFKVDPLTLDAVLLYAQQGHGRRSGLFTDYTFGIWNEGKLVPIAKAYSGLTDAEIKTLDAWIKRHTLDRHGPVRVVEPQLVFELAFEAIHPSNRHKAGYAVRFPRIIRRRDDKTPDDADSIDTLRSLIPGSLWGLGPTGC